MTLPITPPLTPVLTRFDATRPTPRRVSRFHSRPEPRPGPGGRLASLEGTRSRLVLSAARARSFGRSCRTSAYDVVWAVLRGAVLAELLTAGWVVARSQRVRDAVEIRYRVWRLRVRRRRGRDRGRHDGTG
ncbi:hypothetical protein G443_001323 [Actinoalloteichus cyanogriseus DSM 43889]|uniref:Uncharacterized protein n=1 Tax=Actinoalloteichus caeruleus DSM 43889 TaxID=1120930 RepID=A0ABT1JF65_ACTCY|nr:hypothetical protein [Actinoalloteichus caeruleus DSM 43889]